VAPVAHLVVLPGQAERHLEVLLWEVQVALAVLLELEALLVPEPLLLVRQVQSLERFLLLVLQLQVLEWSVWSVLP
jgi:hypothetical protein